MKKPKLSRYFEAVGRRKTAKARVRLFTRGEKKFLINEKPLEVYFPLTTLREKAQSPLEIMKCQDKFQVSVLVRGGGFNAQSEAIRHGLAQALVEFNPEFRKRLKKTGFLTRDPRMRERKKPGLKRARRAPQWHKR
ncbi:30S ribosomal protein S9 [Parcubacteria bacterium DG_74_3]|nr:MAG: 30S ribosomal protein S9 [Parcubacteria bacterium DG_74_3]